ncbi:lamin tail domain-containing protein [Posidoniimonas corsicana]|uniref:lamin tail domain-containing protein n=1 Tax=Posidoniimonas corsicana TaxID=1938618 RepID=UPI0018D2F661|nr:lamin tail domain-containing protein [Posidoniimonas corsicana]
MNELDYQSSGRRVRRLRCEQLEPRLALAGLVISEFLAANTSGLQDEDGDRSDWIELHNDTPDAVDLANWRLTDDEATPAKWTLPSITLQADARLLVFASGKDRAVAGQELHANFALDRDGEYLALVDPFGAVVDAFSPFPEQTDDVSYGRGAVATLEEPLVDEGHPVRVIVPTAATDVVGLEWTLPAYDDAAWTAGVAGVGYERSPSDSLNYSPYIGTDVDLLMPVGRNTAYARFEFNVAATGELADLELRLRYDDGFVAYLNGQEIARTNSPAAASWNSTATGQRSDSQVVNYQTFDVSGYLDAVVEGANVLAIHGLNVNGSSDLLIDPLLLANRSLGAADVYMMTPTPGGANASGTLGFVEDTTFSVDRGFYDEPFDVLITTDSQGAQIRYTLDGSEPTATSGLIYNPAAPPRIASTTVLRAAAFKAGFTPTNVDTQTYLFLDNVLQQDGAGLPPHADWGYQGPDWEMDPEVVNHPEYTGTLRDDLQAVPTVSLVMPWDAWFGGGGEGIYISGTNVERPGSVEFFNAPGADEFQINAALETQGGTSADRWKLDKLSVRATFKAPFGPTDLDADLFTEGLVDGNAADEFDTLIFDAHSNYIWAYGGGANPTDQRGRAKYVQDAFVADLQNQLGGAAPHGRFVHLYINGLYWGMYEMHERPDESFAEAYLGGDKDDYDVIKHTATTVVAGDATAAANYASMLGLVRQNMTVPANYQAAAAVVDVPDLIRYMLVNYYAGNTDWAHHNWYASFNRESPDGRWRFHSWDAEHVLKGLGDNVTLAGNYVGSPEEVHSRLIANPEYRLLFSDMVQEHLTNGGALTPAAAAATYQARVDEIDRAIVGESARWGDSHTTGQEAPGDGGAYTREHWLATQLDLADNYFPNRTGVVLSQFESRGWLVNTQAPIMNQYGGAAPVGFELSLANPNSGGQLYYTLDGSDPRQPGGAVSRGAIAYGGPIELTASTRLRARVLSGGEWSAEVDESFTVGEPLPLRIVELNYHPAEAEDHEFIELLNTGSEPISLDGAAIGGFSETPYAFPVGLSLTAGERIVVARNPAEFTSRYGASVNLAATGYANANLSNSGELVTLTDQFGQVLQAFTYSDDDPWPAAADGGGYTLVYSGPLDADAADPVATEGDPYDDPANWRASYALGGTPGAAESSLPGDYNSDSVVDALDHSLWRATYGSTSDLRADGNGDGTVNAADYTIWRDNLTPAPVPTPTNEGDEAQVAEAGEVGHTEPVAAHALLPAGRPQRSAPARPIATNGGGVQSSDDSLLLLLALDRANALHRGTPVESVSSSLAVDHGEPQSSDLMDPFAGPLSPVVGRPLKR